MLELMERMPKLVLDAVVILVVVVNTIGLMRHDGGIGIGVNGYADHRTGGTTRRRVKTARARPRRGGGINRK